jgi:hypothetical protein
MMRNGGIYKLVSGAVLKMKKPPAAFAGGGLDAAQELNPIRQASFPACAMELLIRRAEIDTAMHIA